MPEPTSAEQIERIKATFAKQAAALPTYSLHDMLMETVRDYYYHRKPTLHAALAGDACQSTLAIACADRLINLAMEMDVTGDRFCEPEPKEIYDDREYHADQKVA